MSNIEPELDSTFWNTFLECIATGQSAIEITEDGIKNIEVRNLDD